MAKEKVSSPTTPAIVVLHQTSLLCKLPIALSLILFRIYIAICIIRIVGLNHIYGEMIFQRSPPKKQPLHLNKFVVCKHVQLYEMTIEWSTARES